MNENGHQFLIWQREIIKMRRWTFSAVLSMRIQGNQRQTYKSNAYNRGFDSEVADSTPKSESQKIYIFKIRPMPVNRQNLIYGASLAF
jgi:hypothetical protein